MQTQRGDWYDTPLYYDIIFDADTPREADFLLDAYQLYRPGQSAPPRILEPACGSGRLMRALQRKGCTVHGFDASPAMVQHTRQRLAGHAPSAHVWEARMEDFTIPQHLLFDLAHCLVSTFKYLLTEEQAVQHLRQVAAALTPGGLYVLGFHLTDYTSLRCQHERWVAERAGVNVVCNTRTWPPHQRNRTEAMRTRLRITEEGQTRVQETHWTFRTYNTAQAKALLRQVPEFSLIACHDFTHDIHSTRRLDDSYADAVLILQRL